MYSHCKQWNVNNNKTMYSHCKQWNVNNNKTIIRLCIHIVNNEM